MEAAEELQNQLIGLSGLVALAAGKTLLLVIEHFATKLVQHAVGPFDLLV